MYDYAHANRLPPTVRASLRGSFSRAPGEYPTDLLFACFESIMIRGNIVEFAESSPKPLDQFAQALDSRNVGPLSKGSSNWPAQRRRGFCFLAGWTIGSVWIDAGNVIKLCVIVHFSLSGHQSAGQAMIADLVDREMAQADRVIRHYLHMLVTGPMKSQDRADTGYVDEKNFVASFLRAMEWPVVPKRALAAYVQLMRTVTLPIAAEICDFDRASPLRGSLAITSQDELIACVMTLLYLRQEDELGVWCWQDLAEEQKKDVSAARRDILKRLRRHLFSEEPLRFLAIARITHPDGTPLEGFGSERLGNVGYSHFGREAMLFALLGHSCGRSLLERIDELLQSDNRIRAPLQSPDASLLALLNAVIAALASDLRHINRKREHYTKNVGVQYYDSLEGGGRAAAGRGSIQRDFLIEAGRKSKSLIVAVSETAALETKIHDVVIAAERAGLTVPGGGGHPRLEAQFGDYLRLSFAFQLLSFLKPSKYTAKDQSKIQEQLGQIFRPLEDPETGNALAVFKSLGIESQLFGSNYNKLLNKTIAATVGAAVLSMADHPLMRDARALLDNLAAHSDLAGSLFPADCQSPVDALELRISVEINQHELDSLPDSVVVPSDLRPKLEALRRTLLQIVLLDGIATLRFGLTVLPETLGGNDRIKDATRAELQYIRSELAGCRTAFLQDHRLHVNKFSEWRADHRRDFLMSCALEKLAGTILEQPSKPDTSRDPMEVKRFFRMKFAESRSRLEKDLWLYRAYNLSRNHEAYGRVYDRISDYAVRTTLPDFWSAYKRLLDREDFPIEFERRVRARLVPVGR